MDDTRDFSRLGDLLGDACEKPAASPEQGSSTPAASHAPRPPDPEDPARSVALVWADLVGVEVAANARPVQLKRGRLVVSVSSPAWAQTLQLMSEPLMARLSKRLGVDVVKEVVFRHAGWEDRRGAARTPEADGELTPAPGLTDDQRAAMAEVMALDLPHELRSRIARAMEAAFARKQE